jgi:hypothetical protein
MRLQKILAHPCGMWLCIVLIIAESNYADGQMQQPKEYSNIRSRAQSTAPHSLLRTVWALTH